MNVLVTDGSYKHTLGIVRSLGRKGIAVTVLGGSAQDLAALSRFCHRFEVVPNPEHESFIDALLEIVRKRHFDLLIPVGYVSTLAVARVKQELCLHTRVEVSDYPEIQAAGNKRRMWEIAKAAGLSVPVTHYPGSLDDVIGHQAELPGRVVIKAVCESAGATTWHVYSKDQLLPVYQRCAYQHAGKQLPMIQEYIPGYGCGFFALYQKGICKRVFMHRRIREYPASGGASSCAESFYDSKLRDYGVRLLDRLNWHGVAMVEFRYDTQDRDYKLLEVNPKFWGSLDLALACGVDFPYYLCQMAEGMQIEYSEHYRTGKRFHWLFSGDLQHCWQRPSSLWSVLNDCLNPRVESNIWWSDMSPNLREAGDAFLAGWNRVRQR